jgi:hypothetical protein
MVGWNPGQVLGNRLCLVCACELQLYQIAHDNGQRGIGCLQHDGLSVQVVVDVLRDTIRQVSCDADAQRGRNRASSRSYSESWCYSPLPTVSTWIPS